VVDREDAVLGRRQRHVQARFGMSQATLQDFILLTKLFQFRTHVTSCIRSFGECRTIAHAESTRTYPD